MNGLAQFIGIESLTVDKLMVILRLLGLNIDVSEGSISLLQDLISGISKSGKYNTLADVLADEELISSIKSFIAPTPDRDDHMVDDRSLIKCPHCGGRFTIKSLRERTHDEV